MDDDWGFPEIRGTNLGVFIIRTIVFWGVYWGSCYLGKLPIIQRPIFRVLCLFWCSARFDSSDHQDVRGSGGNSHPCPSRVSTQPNL